MRLAFRVSYLGSRFYGSQVQESSRTVEGEFIATCRRLDLFDDWRKAGFQSAGRTDRGVHACGQIIAFSTEHPDRAIATLNLQLPVDLWCTGYAEVPAEFHPRFDARSRTYRYYFSDAPDCGRMDQAARHFLGEHNFSNFARVVDKNPWRNILSIHAGEEQGFTCLEVTAHSFLWHQVRCMAWAIHQVGIGENDEDWIDGLLLHETSKPVQPAPAEGLILWETDCGISLTSLPAADRSATYRTELRRHHALMERVCSVLHDDHA
jgi:tRNA pseudouridine38-40 synthase